VWRGSYGFLSSLCYSRLEPSIEFRQDEGNSRRLFDSLESSLLVCVAAEAIFSLFSIRSSRVVTTEVKRSAIGVL